MNIAFIHLSDFHININNDKINCNTIDSIVDSLKRLKRIDKYILIVSGDIVYSGKTNEYKKARKAISQIIGKIKTELKDDYIKVIMVPGNHDLCLVRDARDRKLIQSHYDDGKIDDLLPGEQDFLSNYYGFSYSTEFKPNGIVKKVLYHIDDYIIQFNLINTAPFSTLEPNDKELHYFPEDGYDVLKKDKRANLCITVMHHSCEWFNWKSKSRLEQTIMDNSEMMFFGHDHTGYTASSTINDSSELCISAASKLRLENEPEYNDGFNVVVFDTEKNTVNGTVFRWDTNNKLFIPKTAISHKPIQFRYSGIYPLASYIHELKKDENNFQVDLTKYFVFPKLAVEKIDDYRNTEEISDFNGLKEILETHKRIEICGGTNSGKTTLLKIIYLSLLKTHIPLFWHIENGMRFNQKNLIKGLFEEQFGDDPILFEKYSRLERTTKCLLIDGWDLIDKRINSEKLIEAINEEFGLIIFTTNDNSKDIIETIKDEIEDDNEYIKLEIKPFYKEKRNKLVSQICAMNNTLQKEDIKQINSLIDSLVQNNMDVFSLNPYFIIKYTNYFIQLPLEYSSGESVFNKVFEFELQQAIFAYAKKTDVDEIMIKFEEIAGYMYDQLKDSVTTSEVTEIIDDYNEEYGTTIPSKSILELGTRTKILVINDDCSIRFYNKNHLAYFIAKYLIRDEQNDKKSPKGIEYALRNICFGINSDIILFISYILNNMRIISVIIKQAQELFENWEKIDLDSLNIPLLSQTISTVSPPDKKDSERYEEAQEVTEEIMYQGDDIETIGLFDYDENDINKFPFDFLRAMKYSEMIGKSLGAFTSSMKLSQKKQLVECLYEYPPKVIFRILEPLNNHSAEICNDIVDELRTNGKKKRNGQDYTDGDILKFLSVYAQSIVLATFDHVAELSVNNKTINIILNESPDNTNCEKLQKLLFIENSGNTDLLLKETTRIISENNPLMSMLAKLVMKKHLITNNIHFNKKQQIVDTVFGKENRKAFLLNGKKQ